ncbi:hypothetical protein NHX12_015220 [Muraenolepis orangiensis]|uniref:Uncharacterized protein n=1 Tax=Muraenolepis orangiensis TaxID=630683 RepID=A0A9Q0I4B1_9TELE|nr:hypothetical protein NHX12_015220 [Muraenolepis orangiensis]
MAPRGADSRPTPPYEDLDRQHATHPRRKDPYDYPTHSRPVARDPVPYSGAYPSHQPPPPPAQAQRGGRQPESRQPESRQQRYPAAPPYKPSRGGDHQQQQQHQRHYQYESVGSLQGSAYREPSPERYPPPGYANSEHDERYARVDRGRVDRGRTANRERSASTERYVEPEAEPHAGRPDRYGGRERAASTERYGGGEPYGYRDEGRRADPRQKNPLIGAV